MASLRHGHGNRSPPASSITTFKDYPQSPTSITKASPHFEVAFFDSLPLQTQMNGSRQYYGAYFSLQYARQLRIVPVCGAWNWVVYLPWTYAVHSPPMLTFKVQNYMYFLELISRRPDSSRRLPMCNPLCPTLRTITAVLSYSRRTNKHRWQITSGFSTLLISNPQRLTFRHLPVGLSHKLIGHSARSMQNRDICP